MWRLGWVARCDRRGGRGSRWWRRGLLCRGVKCIDARGIPIPAVWDTRKAVLSLLCFWGDLAPVLERSRRWRNKKPIILGHPSLAGVRAGVDCRWSEYQPADRQPDSRASERHRTSALAHVQPSPDLLASRPPRTPANTPPRLWEQGVGSSNLSTPTLKRESLFNRGFFIINKKKWTNYMVLIFVT